MEAPVHTHQDQDRFDTLSNKLAKYITHTHASTHSQAVHLFAYTTNHQTRTATHTHTYTAAFT